VVHFEVTGETEASEAEEQIHPLEVMRQAYRAMEITFEEDEGTIFTRLNLKNLEAHVISWGELDDLATIIVRLPVRAAPEFRAQAGEFLHRLNFNARRKLWEIDHNDGEIRLAAYTDTMVGPLTEAGFRSLLHCLVMHADTVFPYLTSVLSGRMTPEFAADQAEAATAAMWDTEERDEAE
jgi:hypothetical protein